MGLKELLNTASWLDVERYLQAKYVTTDPLADETKRRGDARDRLALYRGKGGPLYHEMIDLLYKNPTNREKRKALLPISDFQNAIRRVVGEISTVYAAPALRAVGKGDETYQALLIALGVDARMDLCNRLTNLCNATLLWVRARMRNGRLEPRLDVITPDRFVPVANPDDPGDMVGVILDAAPGGLRTGESLPHYQVWLADEYVALDKRGRVLEQTVKPNPYGLLPGVLVNHEIPIEGLLADGGEDLKAGHLAAVLLNVLMLKGQKAGTRQPYVTGDTREGARGQPMDDEVVAELPADVQPGVWDLGQDPNSLISSSRSVVSQVAANHGIPDDVYLMAGGALRQGNEASRQPLKLIRKRQIPTYRDAERELANVLARWVEVSGPEEWRFSTDGWAIDFVEVEEPMSPMDLAIYREKQRHLGHSDPVEETMADNPDLTEAQAEALVSLRQVRFAAWIEMRRALDIATDAGADDPGNTAQQNGRMGGRPPADEKDDMPMKAPMQ